MMNRLVILLVAVCTTALLGCANEDTMPTQKDVQMRKINVISVVTTPVTLTETTRFSWQRELLVAGDDSHNYEANIPALKGQIEKHFDKQGYQFSEVLTDANYTLEGVLLLEGHDELESAENAELLFGLDPGMSPSKEFGVGTLLVGVKDVKTGELMWRGAVQVLTSGDISDDVRQARIDNAIRLLFQGFFEA